MKLIIKLYDYKDFKVLSCRELIKNYNEITRSYPLIKCLTLVVNIISIMVLKVIVLKE